MTGAPAGPLLVLGAGRHQAPLLRRANERGIRTVAVDYYAEPPGKRFASVCVQADALDRAHVLEIAQEHEVTGVTTVGTDQAVLVLAHVAEALGLPCHLTPTGALSATNKSAMRDALTNAGVPMPEAVTSREDGDVEAPGFPCVVKAADSQGQRGMRIVRDQIALDTALPLARIESKTATVVLERFHEGPELTINAWIEGGQVDRMAVLDRITFNPHPHLGICLQHVFPTVHAAEADEFNDIACRVADAYGVAAGPLYIQAIASPDGVRVIEAASRVGGGHEAQLLPRIMGFDLIDRTIDLALGRPRTGSAGTEPMCGLVNFVVARPGTISSLSPMATLVDDKMIDEGGWYVAEGYEQSQIVDSMGRVGYFTVSAPTRSAALKLARDAYAALEILDDGGNELAFWPDPHEINQPVRRE